MTHPNAMHCGQPMVIAKSEQDRFHGVTVQRLHCQNPNCTSVGKVLNWWDEKTHG